MQQQLLLLQGACCAKVWSVHGTPSVLKSKDPG